MERQTGSAKERTEGQRQTGRDPNGSNRSSQPSTASVSILASFMIELIHRNNGEVREGRTRERYNALYQYISGVRS